MKNPFLLRLAYLSTLNAVLLAVGCQREAAPTAAEPEAAPIEVRTIRPVPGDITRNVTLPAFRVLPLQGATLYAKVPGYLKTLMVDKGDQVTQGELLAEIEVPELEADEAQFKAETEVAHTNYERMSEARSKAPDLVVPETVDDLRGKWEIAQAKLQRNETLLQFARIVAPFSGTITARFVDPGAFIPAATSGSTPQSAALVTLMDFHRVRIQVPVPEAEAPFIRNGIPAQVTAEELPGRVFKGSVSRFAHALDEATKTMLTEIELPNEGGDLRPGMYASVQLEVERKRAEYLVPADAVKVEKSGSFAFILDGAKARRTAVRTGFNDGAHVEVTEGLSSDESVILLGKLALNDGQSVNAVEAK